MIITHYVAMDMVWPKQMPVVDVVQDDKYTRNITVSLFNQHRAWEPPSDTVAVVCYKKPDGKGGQYDTLPDGSVAYSIENNVLTIALAPQVLTVAGLVEVTVNLICGAKEINLFPILLRVCANVGAQIAESESYSNVTSFMPIPEKAQIGQFVRISDVYENGRVRGVDAVSLEKAVITIPASETMDATSTDGNVMRRSFHLGGRITLGGNAGYRINRVGIRAAAGTAVRFALYALDDEAGVMTQLAILGDAVADDVLVASLTFEDGYIVQQDNTIILAFAQSATLHCYRLDSGLTVSGVAQFEDADYFANTNGDQIAYIDGELDSGEAVACSIFLRDLDFLTEHTLEEYFQSVDGRIKALEDADPQGGVSSWNDLADKPFYEETTAEVLREYTALEGFSPQSSYGGLYGQSEEPPGYELVLGETYILMYDGIAFECVAQDASALADGAIALGNLGFFADGVGTGEPFIIGWLPEGVMYLDTDTVSPKTSHEIGIYHNTIVVKKLDAKFLPEGTATETYVQQYVESYINEALGGEY